MDSKTLVNAQIYERIKQKSLAYYHTHAEEIAAKRKEKYHQEHPDAPTRNKKCKGMKTDLQNNI